MNNIQEIKNFIIEAQKRRSKGERITADYLIILAFMARGAATRSDLMDAMGNSRVGTNDSTLDQLLEDRMISFSLQPRPVTHQYQKVFKLRQKTCQYKFLNDGQFLFEVETVKKLFAKGGHRLMLNYLFLYILLKEKGEIKKTEAMAEFGVDITLHHVYEVFRSMKVIDSWVCDKDGKTHTYCFRGKWITKVKKAMGQIK